MGRVDKVNQQLHYQHTYRKSYKRYRKLALRLISEVILNAHKVYVTHAGSSIVILYFMHNTIASLLTSTPKKNPWCTDSWWHTCSPCRKVFPASKKRRAWCQRRTTNQRMSCLQRQWTSNRQRQTTENHQDHCFRMYHNMVDYSGSLFYFLLI